MLLSTLKAYFEGKKELFEGLAITELEKTWEAYPVLYLDLNVGKYDTLISLDEVLRYHLSQWEQVYGIKKISDEISVRFRNIITTIAVSTKKKIVILVDEYDKPLIQAIDDSKLQQEFRNTLKAFYGNLKTCDEYVRFAMLTGVTKFSQVSIFSDLNNLTDISVLPQYAYICGITEEELHDNFEEHVACVAQQNGMSLEETHQKLKDYYDGYHFYPDTIGVFNPFSLLSTLAYGIFRNYWYQTGTPTFLVKLLQSGDYQLQLFSNGEVVASDLVAEENLSKNPIALFYQTGYLTIKGFNKEFDTYRLGFPNREVEQSFLNFLLPYYVGGNENRSAFYLENFVTDLRKGDIESFLNRMKTFFADTPYELVRDLENHYQTVMFTVCRLMGYYTKAEYHTSSGLIDMVVKTQQYAYVFEFKFNKTAKEALAQIDAKDYPLPFNAEGRKLFKIGVNFSKETRNIDSFIWKEA